MKLYNFQTLCAGNGKDALALYDETVDLIILDINMQGNGRSGGVQADPETGKCSYHHAERQRRLL